MDLKIKIDEIQVLLSKKKFSEAIKKSEKLNKKFPNNSYFLNLLGLTLQSSGQIQKSIINFKRALEIEQNNFAAMNNLANSYKKLHQYDQAEIFYKRIILKDPKNIKALNNFANLKKDLNKYKDAKKLLLAALKASPKDINILYNIASCCQSLGEMSEAKNYSLKILELDPNNLLVHRFISNITNYQKEPDHLEKLENLLFHKKNTNFTVTEKIDLFFALGGNFLSATPDTHRTARALQNCAMTVQVSINLNRSHLVTGDEALILPCLARSEKDETSQGIQFVTVENSMSFVHSSKGALEPIDHNLKSEVSIISEIGWITPVSLLTPIIDIRRVSSLILSLISFGFTLPDWSTFIISTSKPNFSNSCIGSSTALCSIAEVMMCFLLLFNPNSFKPRIAILFDSVAPLVKIISFREEFTKLTTWSVAS